jgi:hypothetical protein
MDGDGNTHTHAWVYKSISGQKESEKKEKYLLRLSLYDLNYNCADQLDVCENTFIYIHL